MHSIPSYRRSVRQEINRTNMNTKKLITFSVASVFAALSVQGQGTFQNLDFESATPSTPILGPLGTYYQPVGLALPGWTAYLGTVQQTQVLQNVYTEGQAAIDLFGPNYPAAGPSGEGPFNPGVIDGNYSVLLQSGDNQDETMTVGASIAQSGFVPVGSQSLEFRAWQTGLTDFSVSFNGNSLSPVVIGSGANYLLYGADISAYAGQSGQLEFTADFSGRGASWLGLDDITFTAVPEPSPLALTGLGGLLFALHRRFASKQQ
jgi:hypothetical protein